MVKKDQQQRRRGSRRSKGKHWRSYIRKAKRNYLPDSTIGFTEGGMLALEGIVDDLLSRMTDNASDIAHRACRKKTITSRDIELAVLLVFPKAMNVSTRKNAKQAVERYRTHRH